MNISNYNCSFTHTNNDNTLGGKFKVYILYDSAGEIFYVGATEREIHIRKYQHISDSRRKTKTGDWLHQYHISRKLRNLEWKFDIHVICCFEFKEHMFEAEKFHIARLRELGCNLANISSGGAGGTWSLNKICDEAMRKNLCILNSGVNNPNYGKTPSHETRMKQREKMKNRIPAHFKDPIKKANAIAKMKINRPNVKGEANPNFGNRGSKSKLAKVLLQIDKAGNVINKFIGLKEAARTLGYNERSIRKVITGLRKTYLGFIWRYETKNP